ncbi:MAG: 4-hydroxy-tetrahydrodipicolinate synthase [Myxococcales bacterium]|nr:4-hydroxy-tetrahydrodipicolinate synthase [Myxococcales bacterium]USN51674.1 MAG: 4-hydroxy-tetrahydrodipicolinate synthase [Myxococcales bacterium]
MLSAQITDQFKGIHTALVTPFCENGELDEESFCKLLLQQKEEGVHGVVLAGTTGESPTLSTQEKVRLIKIAKDVLNSDQRVIAGAGSNSTRQAIEWQKIMEDAGADATLQVVPYYNKATQDGLFMHFSTIAQNAQKPIIVYNAFGRTGIDLAPQTMAKIALENPLIIGLKDANSNIERMVDMIRLGREAKPNFLFFCGEDSSFFSFLALGADGNISVLSHVAASEMLTLYRCFRQGEIVYAQKIASRLNSLCKILFSHSNPIPIKTILAAMDMLKKYFRLPLVPLSEHDEKVLLEQCNDFDFIKNFKQKGLCS